MMGGGLNPIKKKPFDITLDLTRIKPYGDTMNDGRIQVSFTLPVDYGAKAIETAKLLVEKMGIEDPIIVHHEQLDKGFTFFIVYGSLKYSIDYTKIQVESLEKDVMTMKEIDECIQEYVKRKIVVIGATTGTDAHTLGIDAIMNMKGFAGHHGLERYEMIEAINLGSQLLNEDFVRIAIEKKADVLLVSQTVTQKNIHVKNLTNLVELLEAEGIRENMILICGGSRITQELAKELGYDAGFGSGTLPEDVASFFVKELVKKKKI